MNQFQAPGESHIYGGGITSSALHPAYLVMILVVSALILTVPRKYLASVFVFGIFLIPLSEQIYVAGIHWLAGRILALTGLLRVAMLKPVSRHSLLAGEFNSVDRAFFACTICQAVAFVLLYRNTGAVIYQFGFLIDFLAVYFVIRVMIKDETDIYCTLKALAIIAIILAMAMIYEQVSLQNIFGLLGGTQVAPAVREGKVRSQGVFQHALTAGSFAATSLPLYLMLWKNGKSRGLAAAGMVGCTIMTICSNSSTPLLAWVAGLGAVCLWPIRSHMRTLRRILVITLVTLHVVMKAPVWFLIARIDLTGSSSGYHRAELVDQFIRHFNEWWLIGTSNAGNWGWDLWDQQNQFVNVGESGGLLALVLFIIMIKRAYSRIGTMRHSFERTNREWQMWFLGAALFSNLVSFFGVNYYDQSKVAWFILLAIIIAATTPVLLSDAQKERRSNSEVSNAEATCSLLSARGVNWQKVLSS